MTTDEKIRFLRIKKGLTQEILAYEVEVSRTAIGNWEKGDGLPDSSNLPKLAHVLGTTIDYLLSNKAPMPDTSFINQDPYQKERLLEIYHALIEIIHMYEDSDGFNKIPLDKRTPYYKDAWHFFEKTLDKVRIDANTYFVGQPKLLDRLENLFEEMEYMLKICEIPGVCKRWCQINPKILYFHLSFDLLNADPDLYACIKNEEYPTIRLAYYPTEIELAHRNQYFNELLMKNEKYNYQHSEERWYQNELMNTLKLVFQHDFKDIL